MVCRNCRRFTTGDDLKLLSDAAVLSFGADSDVTLTHLLTLVYCSIAQWRFNLMMPLNISMPLMPHNRYQCYDDEIDLNAPLFVMSMSNLM